MSKMVKIIISILITISLTYISFAFVMANLNPFEWKQEERLEAVLIYISVSILFILYKNDIKKLV